MRTIYVPSLAACVLIMASIAHAVDYPVFFDSTVIGSVSVNPDGLGGVIGGLTALEGAPPSLDATAQFTGAHHFNWFQVIIFDNDAPNDLHGVKQVAPYVDPPLGGYGNPDVQWADGLPWLWDEGADPPPGTPGFSDGLNLSDVLNDFNPGPGPDTYLFFEDVPGGAPDTSLGFETWLVSVTADGTLHQFFDGFVWNWSNPGGGDGSSNVAAVPVPASFGLFRYEQLFGPLFKADFSGNLRVDLGDLAFWTGGFGLPFNAARADGDSDQDHDVDGADFLTWQRELGKEYPQAGQTAVPEPGARALLFIFAVGGALLRRSSCRRRGRRGVTSAPMGDGR